MDCDGVRPLKDGDPIVPVPERLALCVVPLTPPESSVTVSVADSAPCAVGVKIILIVQLSPAKRDVSQSFVSLKSLLLGPVIAMLAIARGAIEAESVSVCAVLGVPMVWLPKFRLAGVSVATGGATRKP